VAFKGKTRIDFMPFKGRRRINSPCVRKVLKFILFFFQIASWSSGSLVGSVHHKLCVLARPPTSASEIDIRH